MKFYKYIFFALTCFLIHSCEDVITVDLEDGDQQLVIDGWIDNQVDKPQVIRLVRTSPYFDSSASPEVTGATVEVTDNTGTVYTFVDNNNGDYIWTPPAGGSFGQVGNSYNLSISTDGKNYTASSTMNRIMEIDSIVSEFREESLGEPEGIYASLFARDFPGVGDAYWIKTYKNGAYLNKPGELNIAYDASFTAGGGIDGVVFIVPIREGINRFPDTADDATDTFDFPPYTTGDSILVEVHSINEDAFFFLYASRIQMTLGDASIFAEPPTNVPTNIVSLNGTEPGDEPVGFFNVAAVSSMGRTF